MDSNGEGGGVIFKLASSINAGNKEIFALGNKGEGGDTTVTRRDSAEQIEFVGAEWLDEETPSGEFLEHWYMKQLGGNDGGELQKRVFLATEGGFLATECDSLRQVFAKVSKSRILCVTRVLDSGSERINALLHRRFVRATRTERSPDHDRFTRLVSQSWFCAMITSARCSTAIRAWCFEWRGPGSAPTVMAVFPRAENFIAFPLDALKEHLELCYAMTVHKAQGSEFDSVAVIMPSKDLPILSREILYTAVKSARAPVGDYHRFERNNSCRTFARDRALLRSARAAGLFST